MTKEAINLDLRPPCDSLELSEWLAWLDQLDPSRIEFGLERIGLVYQRLQQLPTNTLSRKTKIVTIAGTNGKGSCVAALQQAAVALDKSVVSFSSPHLLRYNERIQIQAEPVADAELVAAFRQIAHAQQEVLLTYFEYSALAALLIAARRQPDLLILEVGLGGRLDAVNMIDADIVVLTAIGMDHMDWLGDDLELIAIEKCGVLRERGQVVMAAPGMPEVVYRIAKKNFADVFDYGEAFEVESTGNNSYEIRIANKKVELADLQLHPQSIAAAAMVIELLWPDNLSRIAGALGAARLAGRFQQAKIGSREVILDVAHNPMSMENLCQRLRTNGIKKVDIVFAIMADKDIQSVIALLAQQVGNWYLIRLKTPRALQPEQMLSLLSEAGVETADIVDLESPENWNQIFVGESNQIPLLVCGSFYTVSAILELAERQKQPW